MNVRNFSLILAVAVMSVSSVSAQSDFFFSFTEGGSNSDQMMEFDAGTSGSLWVYWSTNGPADSDLSVGAFIDVMSSTAGVISFTAAETFDYDLTVGGQPSGLTRLNGEGIGSVATESDFVNELAGFTVTGNGILEANNGTGVFTDSGYDAGNDAFQWARIDFDVIGAEGSSTTVTGAAGDGMIVNGGAVVDAAFSTATISVAGGGKDVPEPTTAGLLALGLAGLVARRRR